MICNWSLGTTGIGDWSLGTMGISTFVIENNWLVRIVISDQSCYGSKHSLNLATIMPSFLKMRHWNITKRVESHWQSSNPNWVHLTEWIESYADTSSHTWPRSCTSHSGWGPAGVCWGRRASEEDTNLCMYHRPGRPYRPATHTHTELW